MCRKLYPYSLWNYIFYANPSFSTIFFMRTLFNMISRVNFCCHTDVSIVKDKKTIILVERNTYIKECEIKNLNNYFTLLYVTIYMWGINHNFIIDFLRILFGFISYTYHSRNKYHVEVKLLVVGWSYISSSQIVFFSQE